MLFKRNAEADSSLSQIMQKVGWVVLGYNAFTLFPYFYDMMDDADYWQRVFSSGVAIALMLGIESATMTVLFDPRVLVKMLDKPRVSDKEAKGFTDIISLLGVCSFLLIASYTFWFDYQVNLIQIGKPTVMFLRILAGVFVVGAELAFGCANVFAVAAKENAA